MVMLSTRLTGSSTSMTVVSLRSAASTAVAAPGRLNCSVMNAVGMSCSAIHRSWSSSPEGVEAAIEEHRGVGVDALRSGRTAASGGYQS